MKQRDQGVTSIRGGPAYCFTCRRQVDGWAEGPGGRPGASCPHCQALERHRFLMYLLGRLEPLVLSSRILLDVAPQPQIQRELERLVGHRYLAIDRSGHRPVDLFADLCRLPFPDGSVDLLICYHVLEHIPDDASAIRELARVLDPSGVALLQVPQRENAPTIEDPSAPPEERARRFGRADHVRYYGQDLQERLHEYGLVSARLEPAMVLDEEERRRGGIAPEPVWICRTRGQRVDTDLDGIIERSLAQRATRPALGPPRRKRRVRSVKARLRSLIRKVLP